MYQSFSKIWSIGILTFLTVGGIFAWQYFVVPKEVPEDEMSNWKLYQDEEYKFEIKYSADWFVRKDSSTGQIYFGEKKEITDPGKEKITVEKIGFTVTLYSNQGELPGNQESYLELDDWISKTSMPLKNEEVKTIISVGPDNYDGILLKKYKEVGVVKLFNTVFLKRNWLIYELKSEVSTLATELFQTKYDYEKVFNQMLSTFKFLEYETEEGLKFRYIDSIPQKTYTFTDLPLKILEVPKEIVDLYCVPEGGFIERTKIDLNKDGTGELIIFSWNSCPDGHSIRDTFRNGPIDIFQKIDNRWKKIGSLEGNSINVEEMTTYGYVNLLTWRPVSVSSGILSSYIWNLDTQKYNLVAQTKEIPWTSAWRVYRSEEYGFEIKIPPNLTFFEGKGNSIIAKHSLQTFKHKDPCDFIGTAPLREELVDLNFSFEILRKKLAGVVRERESEYFIMNYFIDDKLKTSEGFIDEVARGLLSGYQVYHGVEGCGYYTYYFSLTPDATLVVTRYLIPELTQMTYSKDLLELLDVISPNEEKELFNQMLSTFRFLK